MRCFPWMGRVTNHLEQLRPGSSTTKAVLFLSESPSRMQQDGSGFGGVGTTKGLSMEWGAKTP